MKLLYILRDYKIHDFLQKGRNIQYMQICICVNSCLNAKCERIKLSTMQLLIFMVKCSAHFLPMILYIKRLVTWKLEAGCEEKFR